MVIQNVGMETDEQNSKLRKTRKEKSLDAKVPSAKHSRFISERCLPMKLSVHSRACHVSLGERVFLCTTVLNNNVLHIQSFQHVRIDLRNDFYCSHSK